MPGYGPVRGENRARAPAPPVAAARAWCRRGSRERPRQGQVRCPRVADECGGRGVTRRYRAARRFVYGDPRPDTPGGAKNVRPKHGGGGTAGLTRFPLARARAPPARPTARYQEHDVARAGGDRHAPRGVGPGRRRAAAHELAQGPASRVPHPAPRVSCLGPDMPLRAGVERRVPPPDPGRPVGTSVRCVSSARPPERCRITPGGPRRSCGARRWCHAALPAARTPPTAAPRRSPPAKRAGATPGAPRHSRRAGPARHTAAGGWSSDDTRRRTPDAGRSPRPRRCNAALHPPGVARAAAGGPVAVMRHYTRRGCPPPSDRRARRNAALHPPRVSSALRPPRSP